MDEVVAVPLLMTSSSLVLLTTGTTTKTKTPATTPVTTTSTGLGCDEDNNHHPETAPRVVVRNNNNNNKNNKNRSRMVDPFSSASASTDLWNLHHEKDSTRQDGRERDQQQRQQQQQQPLHNDVVSNGTSTSSDNNSSNNNNNNPTLLAGTSPSYSDNSNNNKTRLNRIEAAVVDSAIVDDAQCNNNHNNEKKQAVQSRVLPLSPQPQQRQRLLLPITWTLPLLVFVDSLGDALVVPLIAQYYKQAGLTSASQRELLTTLYSLSQFVSGLTLSYALHFSNRTMLAICFIGSGLSYGMVAYSTTFSAPSLSLPWSSSWSSLSYFPSSTSSSLFYTPGVCIIMASRILIGLVKQTRSVTTALLSAALRKENAATASTIASTPSQSNTPHLSSASESSSCSSSSHERAKYMGRLRASSTMAWIAGPSVGAVLYSYVHPQAPALLSCALFLLNIVLLTILLPPETTTATSIITTTTTSGSTAADPAFSSIQESTEFSSSSSFFSTSSSSATKTTATISWLSSSSLSTQDTKSNGVHKKVEAEEGGKGLGVLPPKLEATRYSTTTRTTTTRLQECIQSIITTLQNTLSNLQLAFGSREFAAVVISRMALNFCWKVTCFNKLGSFFDDLYQSPAPHVVGFIRSYQALCEFVVQAWMVRPVLQLISHFFGTNNNKNNDNKINNKISNNNKTTSTTSGTLSGDEFTLGRTAYVLCFGMALARIGQACLPSLGYYVWLICPLYSLSLAMTRLSLETLTTQVVPQETMFATLTALNMLLNIVGVSVPFYRTLLFRFTTLNTTTTTTNKDNDHRILQAEHGGGSVSGVGEPNAKIWLLVGGLHWFVAAIVMTLMLYKTSPKTTTNTSDLGKVKTL